MLHETPAALFIVLTNPIPGKENEYNEWYTNVHLKEVVALEGFLSARRFKLTEAQHIKDQPYKYLAIYEVQHGRAQAIIDNLLAGSQTMTIAPVMDFENIGGFLAESISDTVSSQNAN